MSAPSPVASRPRRPPSHAFEIAVGVYVAVWTVVPTLVASAPPLDVVEGYAFGRAGLLVTHEHPNLPGLLLTGLRQLTHAAGWPAYLLSAGAMAASLILVQRLGRDVLGEPGATAGAALLFGLFYYQWPVPEWNHNVAQVPLWAAVCLTLWRAVHDGRRRWWCWLGLAAGAALWAKHAAVVVIGLAALYVLAEAAGRRQLRTVRPWLALALWALIVAPQVVALAGADWAPLVYAAGRTGAQADAGTAGSFLLAQVADHAVLAVIGGSVAALAWRAGARTRPQVAPPARRFLLLFGLGPVLGTAAGAAVLGVGLQDMWGMPMMNLSGLLLVMLVPGLATPTAARRIGLAGGTVSVLVAAGYGAHIALAPLYRETPHRESWPQDRIAAAAREAVADAAGAPAAGVAGPGWLAGLVILDTPATYRPTGPAAASPRLGGGDAQGGPVLALGTRRPPTRGALSGYTTIDRGALRVAWTRWRDRPPVTVPYAVLVRTHAPAARRVDRIK